MKKKLFTIAIALCMILTMMPGGLFQAETAWAAGPGSVEVDKATYHANGALGSITATFNWSGAISGVQAELVLMEKKLNGGETDGRLGDFSDLGTYGGQFNGHAAAKAYDDIYHSFGFIANSGLKSISYSDNSVTFNLDATAVPLNINKNYYIYIWTQFGSIYYPDYIVCAISVQDGVVKYAPANGKGRNTYDETELNPIESETQYSVTVMPGKNMTKTTGSGEEKQTDLSSSMTPVVYTAEDGYYFPNDYDVTTANGIMVRRDSSKQITVYGAPSANATITLNDATEGTPPAENTVAKPVANSGIKYDGNEKTGVANGAGYTLDGAAKGTNAGNYSVTAKLSEDMQWSDGTTADVVLNWSIAPADTVQVTVADITAYVGDAAPAPSYSVSELFGSDRLGGTGSFQYIDTSNNVVDAPDMSKAGTYKIRLSGLTPPSENYEGIAIKDGTLTIKAKQTSGGGHSYTQKPTIIAKEGADTTLTFSGTKLTITAKDGYEIEDVMLNGISKGAIGELNGLRTGDKVEIKAVKKAEPTEPTKPDADKNTKLINGVKNTSIILKSKLTKGEKVLLTWTKSRGYKVDYFEFYRSTKKSSGYGKTAFFTTKDGKWTKYLNTKDLKAGSTCYYKVRGVRIIDGKKYYTQWSNKTWRTIAR